MARADKEQGLGTVLASCGNERNQEGMNKKMKTIGLLLVLMISANFNNRAPAKAVNAMPDPTTSAVGKVVAVSGLQVSRAIT